MTTICNMAYCTRSVRARGLCGAHYERWRTGSDLDAPIRGNPDLKCSIVECGGKHWAKGWCQHHYNRFHERAVNGECRFDGCARSYVAKGFCPAHYAQLKNGWGMEPLGKPGRRRSRLAEWESDLCKFADCGRSASARGLCEAHYNQNRKGLDLSAIKFRQFAVDGWRVGSGGYIVRSHKSVGGKFTTIQQHRFVMEEHLGRVLVKGENIHHINGDRADNRLDNLELWNTAQPPGQRIEDKVAWAKELLVLYEPASLRIN
jgi:hypothetical protein